MSSLLYRKHTIRKHDMSYFATALWVKPVTSRFFILSLAITAACLNFVGCVFPVTRTVEDVYTTTTEDTTTTTIARNQPGNRENGIVYPAPRIVERTRTVVQTDTTLRREYPAFIRYGVFESVGLIGTASSGQGIGTGVFGVYYDPVDLLASEIKGKSNKVFGGALYRLGIVEYRLRWFQDAPDWTIGTSMIEMIYPEATVEKQLSSFMPLYVRKRYFLREQIPYICITPSVGFGWYPSQYANLSVSADIGSMGGLNFRSYVGFIAGVNAPGTTFNDTKTTVTVARPYFGFGVSLMDFLNRVPELDVEWKDHEHSAWNVGIAQFTLMLTSQDSSFFANSFPFQGMELRLLPTSIALPWLSHRLYAGTDLASLVIAGGSRVKVGRQTFTSVAIGLGILPLRVGYWQPVLKDELSFEPFIEYSYYPTSMFQIGARLNLFALKSANVSLNVGYLTCSGFDTASNFFSENIGTGIGAFSTIYAGISIGFLDRIFSESELRYHRTTGAR